MDKFVEFYGDGLDNLAVTDRVMIANMSPENGATVTYFPVDQQTLAYLRLTGRPPELVELVEAYYQAQGLFRRLGAPDPAVHQHARTGHGHGRAQPGGSQAPAGPRGSLPGADKISSRRWPNRAPKTATPSRPKNWDAAPRPA